MQAKPGKLQGGQFHSRFPTHNEDVGTSCLSTGRHRRAAVQIVTVIIRKAYSIGIGIVASMGA